MFAGVLLTRSDALCSNVGAAIVLPILYNKPIGEVCLQAIVVRVLCSQHACLSHSLLRSLDILAS